MRKWLIATALTATLGMAAPPTLSPLENHVRHQLVMLPYLNIFDDISFRVDGATVTLFGEVTKPVSGSDAENAVKRVEGVARVENQIEVAAVIHFTTTEFDYAQRAPFTDIRRCNDMERVRIRRFTSS